MGSISLNSLSILAGVTLAKDLTLSIQDGDRVGLVAGNGLGKTTLLRTIAGLHEPAAGAVVTSRGLKLGYVEQDVPLRLRSMTLRDAVLDALPAEDQETDSWRADVVLDEFETPDALRSRLVSALSGGWQRLMLLMRVWVTAPDALLLDEPTNHLDLGRIFALEAWLNQAARNLPVVIASHDRDFLDAVTNRTLFLRPETSRFFALPYSDARAALEEIDAADAVRLDRDLKEARQLRKQAAKLTNIGINSGSDLLTVKAKQLKERASKIESNVTAVHKERSGDIRLASSGTHARVLLAIEDATVTTPLGAPLFRIDKLHVFQGDRVVLLGPNGAGKSQLVRMIRRAMQGETVAGLRVAGSVVLGYTDQGMAHLDETSTPDEVVGAFRLGDQRSRALLAGAGFELERQTRSVSKLSFGQRARLGLLALRLSEPNVYLMDEPTNHVDIAGQEALESEIIGQGATAILVSHDRRFVRNVGTRYLEIRGRRLVEVDGPEAFFKRMAAEAE